MVLEGHCQSCQSALGIMPVYEKGDPQRWERQRGFDGSSRLKEKEKEREGGVVSDRYLTLTAN